MSRSQVRQLFEEALDLPPEDRGTFLRSIEDGDVRADVQALLQSDEEASNFLEGSPVSGFASGDPLIGQLFAGFELVRKIGEGGMGTVYEALQEATNRRVAFKVLSSPLVRDDVTRRFRREASVLAHLEHPNIARLYESGTVEIGGFELPFMAIELIREARTITEFVREKNLDRAERIQLFLDVAKAIRFGHQNGVIHRDLKPENILVGDDGVPKVIDFGIARTTDLNRTRTNTGELLGTPRFMSPEQLEGRPEAVDARADVYALGLLFYEILTDGFPYDLEEASPHEVIRIVREVEPHRVSSVDATLRGDLDILVARTLEKNPDERYASVDQLIREVESFLEGKPIEARRDNTLYVWRKAIARNRALITVLSMVLLVFVAASISFAYLWRRAEDAREESDRNLYANQMALAANALETRRIGELKEVLAACAPEFRGWEWGHLKARADDSLWTFGDVGRPISAMESSPSGGLIAIGDWDGTIQVWDVDERSLVRKITIHKDDISGLRFLPDDEGRLVSASRDKTIRVIDIESGEEERRLSYDEEIWSLEMTPEGERVVAGLRNGNIVIRHLFEDREPVVIKASRVPVLLSLSPDGRTLASAADLKIQFWDLSTGEHQKTIDRSAEGRGGFAYIPVHGGSITGLIFDNTGDSIYSAGTDGYGKLWDVESKRLVYYENYERSLRQMALSPDGSILGIMRPDSIELRRTADAFEFPMILGHDAALTKMTFLRESNHLAVAAYDGRVKLFDVTTRGGTYVLGKNPYRIDDMCVAPDSKTIFTGDEAGFVKIWEVDSMKVLASWRAHPKRIRSVAVSPSGKHFATSSDDFTVRIWDAASREMTHEMKGGWRSRVHWSQGNRIVFHSETSPMRVYDGDSLELLLEWKPERGVLTSGCVHASREIFALGSNNKQIYVWDLDRLSMMRSWGAGNRFQWILGFIPDKNHLVTTSEDRELGFWDWQTEEFTGGIGGFLHSPVSVALTEDQSRLICLPMFGNPRLIHVDRMQTLFSVRGHDPDVILCDIEALAGGAFISSDSRGFLRVWTSTTP